MNPPRRYTDYLVSWMGIVGVIGLLIAALRASRWVN